MRFELSTTILALMPLALCSPALDVTDLDASKALDIRAAEPAPILEPINLKSRQDTFFMVTAFEAFMPSPTHESDTFSRTSFNVTLMHPEIKKRWTVTCMALTKAPAKLCDPGNWSKCMDVDGALNENEELSFNFGDKLTSVNIRWKWNYQNVRLTTMASEPATWSESVNKGNVTVSEWGKFYEKPEGWVFAWRSIVG